jgi:hypothetical protein
MPPSVDYCQLQHVGVAAQCACLLASRTAFELTRDGSRHNTLSLKCHGRSLTSIITVATNGMRTRQITTTTTRRRVPKRRRNMPKHIGCSGHLCLSIFFLVWWHDGGTMARHKIRQVLRPSAVRDRRRRLLHQNNKMELTAVAPARSFDENFPFPCHSVQITTNLQRTIVIITVIVCASPLGDISGGDGTGC